ncbi:hypothetical protein IEC338SC_3079 [Acinetobacter pittii]|uniref:Uncharacterized protein n=1 Tax=Acinetobacter pittii TaxID=48296 RepID=A0AB33BBJ7_ACIPI|nr:hypothetical protein [Acinetobacter pittii]AMX20193.1 hypothetical protein IEC338SC_3079 [Acinetobacter pittii]
MDNKSRNLELEAWLIETTGEEMMANHLGPNWNRFDDEFGFYPNMGMTVADLVWQHQQAKVEGLQEEFAEDERFLKEQIKDKDLKISNLEYLQRMDRTLIQTLWGRSAALQDEVNELQKQLIDQGQRFNEQAQVVKDLEFKNGELQKRVGTLKVRLSEATGLIVEDLEQALKGEG